MSNQSRFYPLIVILIAAATFIPHLGHALSAQRIPVEVGGSCAGLFSGGRQAQLTDENHQCLVTLTTLPDTAALQDTWIVVTQQKVATERRSAIRPGRNYRRIVIQNDGLTVPGFLLKGRGRKARYTVRAFASPELRIDDPALTTCDRIFNEFAAESFKIRSCISDADCGQALTGTSCGCTRDHVARKDADTNAFYQVLRQAKQNGCTDSLPITSACDCPQVSGTACIAGMCDWKS